MVTGPFGAGSSGAAYAFNDAQFASTAGPITAMHVSSGNWINSLQVLYGGQAAPLHGSPGGDSSAPWLSLGFEEYISGATVSSGAFVDIIVLTTSLGRSFALGYGTGGTNATATPACGNVTLVSIAGVSKDYLEQITFTWAPSVACQLVTGPFGPGLGGPGSGGSTTFDDAQAAAAGGPITALQVYSGSWMNTIQVFYGGQAGPVHGTPSGGPDPLLTMGPGEYISAVAINSGWYVGSIQVNTSLGRSVMLGPGGGPFSSATPTCGSVGGRPPALVSISGVANDYPCALTFTWGPPPAVAPSPPPAPPPNPTPPPNLPASVVIAGPFGAGDAGADPAFDEGANAGPITSIAVQSGQWMYSIQVSYGGVQSAVHGGGGGADPVLFTLAPNEHITSAMTRIGGYVEAIVFTTNQGRTLSLGNGLQTDGWASVCPVGQYRLAAIRGTAGDYVSGLTFVWARLPGAPSTPAATPGWTCRYGRNEVLHANGTQPQCLGLAGGTSCIEGSSCEAMLPCVGSKFLAAINTCTPGVSTTLGAQGAAPTGDYPDPLAFCPRAQGALGLPVGPSPVLIQVVILSVQVCNSTFSASMDEINTAIFGDPCSLSPFWNAVSYGRAKFDATTTTMAQLTLPCSAFSATTCAYDDWMAYIDANYAALGVPTWPNFPYHRMLIGPNTFSYSCGAGFSAGNNVYINGDYVHNPLYNLNTIKHELGHSIGLFHASTWTNGGNNEYGDPSSPMGSCQRCSYVAPSLLFLGWATPIATLHGVDLSPGVTFTFHLPALVDSPKNAVVIRVDWARLNPPVGARPVGAIPTIFLSYRVAKGQDVGLPDMFDQAVSVHSVASGGGGGNSYMEAALKRGAAWSGTNFNLAVATGTGAATPADGVHVHLCRFVLSVTECGNVFNS